MQIYVVAGRRLRDFVERFAISVNPSCFRAGRLEQRDRIRRQEIC
jgi:hypothetical protein